MSRYKVTDISNYFIDYFSRSVDMMTLPRVQLFVYYAQAESLCRWGRPLFDDEFRAYTTGPAIPRLNAYYEEAGNRPIDVYRDYDVNIFSRQDLELLMDVATYYNKFSTSQLQIMSLSRESPWEQVYSGPNEIVAIDNSLIMDHFLSKPRVPSHLTVMLQAINDSCVLTEDSFFDTNISKTTVAYSDNEVMDSWQ
jgi:uncharacterized phage-associated protein